jgi:hypothetical protein
MKEFVVGLILIFAVSGYAYAQSVKESYELKERCGKRAKETFNKDYGKGYLNTDDRTFMITYANHYNRKLKKCFVMLNKTGFPKKKDKFGIVTDKTLWDINEMKQYGGFFKFSKMEKPLSCQVLNKVCNSEVEWDSLVKPYMEE